MVRPSDPAAVSLTDVEFQYGSSTPSFSLTLPELTVEAGERVALVGASGSGKSTLLGLITGVLTPMTGQVRVFGHAFEKIRSAERDKLRSKLMGIIFQQFNLLPYLTIIDNVVLALEFSASEDGGAKLSKTEKVERAQDMLKALDLDVTQLGNQQASSLSVGQQQRVAAARAFVGKPPLIIADEPTSALDEGRQTEFLKLLFAQQEATGATLMMVTHDPRIAAQFERVLNLDDICNPSASPKEAS